MKKITINIIAVFVTILIYTFVTKLIQWDYNVFRDSFNLFKLAADMGIFVFIFIIMNLILKKVFLKKEYSS